jgi:hypothetical protein
MANLPSINSELQQKYDVANNTLISKWKDCETEIGDALQISFFPQVKLKKWDNEVNFSLRLLHNETGNETIEYDGSKVRWKRGFVEAHFYDKGFSEDGAFEFEVLLKKKPPVNSITFSIQTKGLDFFYQPAIPENSPRDISRPENVVGSYAAYHKTEAGDKTALGGKNYRAGKAFHIYRPHLTDALGNTTYADLFIDEQAGTLTITAPQDFIDNAVYPVLVDPTFGYTTAGATGESNDFGNDFFGSSFTAPENGTANSVTVRVQSSFGSINLKGLLVLNSDLNIVTNGVTNAGAISGTPAWITASFGAPPSFVGLTDYVIGYIADGGGGIFSVYDTGATNQGAIDGSNNYTTPTNPTDASRNTNKYSIYVTYTADGAPAPTILSHATQSIGIKKHIRTVAY